MAVDGRRRGKRTFCALLQSRYSVVSCDIQKSPASSCERNFGTALSFLAGFGRAAALLSTHITDGDDANAVTTDGERGGE